jgi:acetolactate synthase-1/2/3 large subunit
MRNGGQVLVQSLAALGATRAFGVPGESYLAVLDALHDTAGRLDYVLCRNEGGAAFMAAAWGKLTGSPGICMVTRGPGVTNASIGIHTAMQDSAPMIVFVGQVGTDMIGREAFQEIDYPAVFGTLAKWAVQIDRVERIPEVLSRAWATATTGRPGPVVVALPEDMLTCLTDVAPLTRAPRITEPAPDAAAVDEALALLQGAARPLVLVGGCNWSDAGRAAMKAWAEASDIPVIAAFRYQDRFDNHSPCYAGEAGVGMPPHVKALVRAADVVLAVNVRFGEMTTDGYTLLSVPVPAQTLIHAHGSDREIGKVYQPTLGIHAGPNALAMALRPVTGPWAAWREQARAGFLASMEAPAQPSPVDMVAVMRHLRAVLPPDAILTNGAGNFAVWPNKFYAFGPQARLLAPQSGAMGYGVPAAIAARVAHPGRTVVCFAGDGDFQMTCPELGTAMQAHAQPVILILNNGTYGTIRAHQERTYPARVSGTDLANPDFVALARAYGFHAERVETTEGFAAAFDRALASTTGAVLDLAISAEALTPRQTLSQMRAAALAKGAP